MYFSLLFLFFSFFPSGQLTASDDCSIKLRCIGVYDGHFGEPFVTTPLSTFLCMCNVAVCVCIRLRCFDQGERSRGECVADISLLPEMLKC